MASRTDSLSPDNPTQENNSAENREAPANSPRPSPGEQPNAAQDKESAEARETSMTSLAQGRRGKTESTRIESILDWSIKVFGIAAAILFGIWAPLSYRESADANSSSDAAQSSVMSLQSSVASQQSAALESLNSRVGAIGQLWLYDFCAGQTALPECKSFTNSVAVASLISYLASPTSKLIESSAPAPSNVTGGSGHGGLAVSAILGIVFGILGVIGIAMGLIAQRYKHRKYRVVDTSLKVSDHI